MDSYIWLNNEQSRIMLKTCNLWSSIHPFQEDGLRFGDGTKLYHLLRLALSIFDSHWCIKLHCFRLGHCSSPEVSLLRTSFTETLRKKASSHIKRWLGLSRSLNSTAIYGHSNKLQLPIMSLKEEVEMTRTRKVLLYRESRAGIEVRTGRKRRAEEAVL